MIILLRGNDTAVVGRTPLLTVGLRTTRNFVFPSGYHAAAAAVSWCAYEVVVEKLEEELAARRSRRPKGLPRTVAAAAAAVC